MTADRGLSDMIQRVSVTTTIPLSRGAPSLDIVDIEGLSEAAARAFENDPAGIAGYGTSIGYRPLRKLIAEWHGVAREPRARDQRLASSRRVLFRRARQARDRRRRRAAELRPHAARASRAGRLLHPIRLAPDGIDIEELERRLKAGLRPALRSHHLELPEPGRLHDLTREAPAGCWRSPVSTSS